jgi:hypothetical protein
LEERKIIRIKEQTIKMETLKKKREDALLNKKTKETPKVGPKLLKKINRSNITYQPPKKMSKENNQIQLITYIILFI